MSLYYDRDGNPMTAGAWAEKFGDRGYKIVASDEFDDVKVSTVWLGLDHGGGFGTPVIFETMIFGGEWDDDCWRYSTEAEAVAGHEAACAQVRSGEVAA